MMVHKTNKKEDFALFAREAGDRNFDLIGTFKTRAEAMEELKLLKEERGRWKEHIIKKAKLSWTEKMYPYFEKKEIKAL